MLPPIILAPPLSASRWFNTTTPITLEALRGRVVVLHAFQMLCPGCVAQGLPQAKRVQQTFQSDEVVVLGLHTVFEHHAVMGPDALKAFLYEYRIEFPVAVDSPATGSSIPSTMQAYELRGTPSLIVIDRQGVVRLNHFGHIEDLQLGALIGALISEPTADRKTITDKTGVCGRSELTSWRGCDDQQCDIQKEGVDHK